MAKSRLQLQGEAEKQGKVSFTVWQEAKRTGQDPELVQLQDEKRRRKYQQELSDYEKYVYGKVKLSVTKSKATRPVHSVQADAHLSTATRGEMLDLLRAFVVKNENLGLAMPDEMEAR